MESKAIEMQMSFRNCCCCCDVGGGGGWIQRRGLIPIVGCSLHRTYIYISRSTNSNNTHSTDVPPYMSSVRDIDRADFEELRKFMIQNHSCIYRNVREPILRRNLSSGRSCWAGVSGVRRSCTSSMTSRTQPNAERIVPGPGTSSNHVRSFDIYNIYIKETD